MAQIETWYKQDLTQPVHVHHLQGNVFSQDNQGNLIGVEVFDDGVPASLSGSVSANIVRSDGGTVAVTGTLSGNKLSVVLPSSAYAVPGIISIVLKLTTGAVIVSMLAVVAVVYASSTDTPVDPGTIMPSIQELIEEIEEAVASIPPEYDDLTEQVDKSTYDILPMMLPLSDYTGSVSLASFLISDITVKAGSLIKAVQVYSFDVSNNFYFYLINKTSRRIVYKKIYSLVSGYNYIPIMYAPDADCYFGVYGHTFKSYAVYHDSGLLPENKRFSVGYYEGDIKPANIGDQITITNYSTNLDLAFPISLVIKQSGDFQTDKQIIDGVINRHITEPIVLGATTQYDEDISRSSFLISDREIPVNSFIKSVRLYNFAVSNNIYIYLIDAVTNIVKHCIRTTAQSTGWMTIPVNYINTDGSVVVGVYGHAFYQKTYVSKEYAFSDGYIEGDIKPAEVGDEITATSYSSGINVGLPIQWDFETIDADYINSRSSYEHFKTVSGLSDDVCIASFIDDSGINVPDIWGEIIEETGIRMGFACVAGYISGAVQPTQPQYEQMALADLKALYDAGHEVYSHSWSHPAFYESNEATIIDQCFKSKDWVLSQGFFRGCNVIVYPGGLGFEKQSMQEIIKRFYKYGIEATGGGLNNNKQILYKPHCITRINADTSTLSELKDKVDKAYSEKQLIVFMNHAYELNNDRNAQIQKMIDIIEYIKDKNIPIMPIGEALNRIM